MFTDIQKCSGMFRGAHAFDMRKRTHGVGGAEALLRCRGNRAARGFFTTPDGCTGRRALDCAERTHRPIQLWATSPNAGEPPTPRSALGPLTSRAYPGRAGTLYRIAVFCAAA